MKKYLFRSF